jgi:hypothetical protein
MKRGGPLARRTPLRAKAGITRGKPLRAKRWGVSRSKRGTKHGRREREFGRMKCARETMACAALLLAATSDIGPCIGRAEYMHLGPRKGYRAPDCEGAKGCSQHHQDIDQTRAWYLALTDEARADFRARAIAAQKEAWDSLTPEQRAWWDERAAIEFAKNRRGA